MNPYSDDAVAKLRNVLFCYNQFEIGSWKRTAEEMKIYGGDQSLRRFAKGQSKPKFEVVSKVYGRLNAMLVKRDQWKRPWAIQCRDDLIQLFDRSSRIDPYRLLKKRAKLNDREQKIDSSNLKGDYLAVRPHSDEGCILSHMRMFDSFATYGLTTCRFGRATRLAGEGPIEGDLVTDGGVFRKPSSLNILAYDTESGDVSFMALMETGDGSYRGLTTGFNSQSLPFSAWTVIQALPAPTEYQEIRENTGWWQSPESLGEYLAKFFGKNHLFVQRCKAIDTADYIISPPNR